MQAAEAAWLDWLSGESELQGEPVVENWVREGRPFVVRRRLPGEAENEDVVPLGLVLPLVLRRRRVPFSLPAHAICSLEAPPAVADCAASAPADWRPFLDRLAALSGEFPVQIRVFGSLAWERLTGLPYLTERSDLDLLVQCEDGAIDDVLVGLEQAASGAPMRIDAELARPDGRAAHWRELRSDAADVLVKGDAGGELCNRLEFLRGRS